MKSFPAALKRDQGTCEWDERTLSLKSIVARKAGISYMEPILQISCEEIVLLKIVLL